MREVTGLLSETEPGHRRAAERLLPLVYDELRKLAAARMDIERADHTRDATALAHEAYLRSVGDQQFGGRAHFFAAAAHAMRRVVVDHSQNRARMKRRGVDGRIDLGRLTELAAATD
jgi:RNA polymerase sigma factor (TIGR02999 family)